MNLQEFINTYNGKGQVGTTRDNTGQCVGLVIKWLVSTLKQPMIWGHAKDLITNADRNAYEIILNTPDAIPQAGDVIVWTQGFNGTFGHTAIATGKATVNTFEVFEQNNPLGAACRLYTYRNYAYVQGWIRPKVAKPAPQPTEPVITDQTKIPQLENMEVQAIVSKVHDLTRDYKGALIQARDLKRQLDEMSKEFSDYMSEHEKCITNQSSQPKQPTLTEQLLVLLKEWVEKWTNQKSKP